MPLDWANDFVPLDDTTRSAVQLTEREKALLASALFYLEDYRQWVDYSGNSEDVDDIIAECHYRLSV
jgi:hypothetical protein